jgi:transcriptional regulator with XRE-family HTH domain
MTLQKAANKRRLIDITVKEVSVVKSPAINEEFIVVKSTDAESFMNKIKSALAEKGMTVEQLAEATGIDVKKLSMALETGEGLDEEEMVKIAEALELEKLDDDEPAEKKPEDKPAEDKPAAEVEENPEEKQEEPEGEGMDMEPKPEGGEEEPPSSGGESMHKKLLMEKLEAVKKGVDSIAGMLDSEDSIEIHKKLYALSDVIWQLHGDADIAVLTKSADTAIREDEDGSGVIKALELLGEALVKTKDALAEKNGVKTPESKIEKDADSSATTAESQELEALKKEHEKLRKKIAGLEKSGVSKSLPEDDKAPVPVKKQLEWSCLGPEGSFE